MQVSQYTPNAPVSPAMPGYAIAQMAQQQAWTAALQQGGTSTSEVEQVAVLGYN